MTIEPATRDDIPALMRLERGAGFDRLVRRWSEPQHAAELANPGSRYLVARSATGEALGFVLLQGLDDPQACATLRRIAVARPGAGLGATLLDAALDHAFGTTQTHRVQLRVYPENERARRVYVRAGFVAEGVLREVSRAPDGTFRSMLSMAILRPEWESRRDVPPRQ